MGAEDRTQDVRSVDRAMNQVLLAEQEARDAVEQCRAEAARIRAEAEERARRIAQGAERRIRLAHRIADRAVARAQQRLRGPDSGSGLAIPTREARALLERAVDALVEEILDGPA